MDKLIIENIDNGEAHIMRLPAITPQSLETFFSQPGINITGVCSEAGIAKQYLNRCRKAQELPGSKVMQKLLPVMVKYGYK